MKNMHDLQTAVNLDATKPQGPKANTPSSLNTLRLRQNDCHFPDDHFKCIFLNENVWILIKISLKFVPQHSINNIPALVHIMAWRRLGDKPLSEPMMVSLLMHVFITRPQRINSPKYPKFLWETSQTIFDHAIWPKDFKLITHMLPLQMIYVFRCCFVFF